ncbi:MAG: hypothetical protein AB1733_22670 [Thermodesulfobacteriota bacterium]
MVADSATAQEEICALKELTLSSLSGFGIRHGITTNLEEGDQEVSHRLE